MNRETIFNKFKSNRSTFYSYTASQLRQRQKEKDDQKSPSPQESSPHQEPESGASTLFECNICLGKVLFYIKKLLLIPLSPCVGIFIAGIVFYRG